MLHFKFGMALWLFHIPLMFGDELSINGRTAFRICYNNGIGKKNAWRFNLSARAICRIFSG